ncbi:alpha-catulin-like isoform X2 [Tachypleus tridentatus]|uniref:alpha-catulin-like isoform X2 n=1 Tax=Tachypleus tridentatus TaxID=6853 RepID=UPI003FD02A65
MYGRSEKAGRALLRVGQAVTRTVERLVTVGECIAEDNPEIKVDMYEACRDARTAALLIEQFCESQRVEISRHGVDRSRTARATRGLLASITKILILADTVVVQQLLSSKERVSTSLNNISNFTEFVKIFGIIGTEMVELAYTTGDTVHNHRDDRRRAQMKVANQVLQRSSIMFLTSSKACLRHPDCETVRENRDSVFLQMRRAMDLIHCIIKDGVIPDLIAPKRDNTAPKRNGTVSKQNKRFRSSVWKLEELEQYFTVHNALNRFEDLLDEIKTITAVSAYRGQLLSALETIMERTQDFTDSAYTSHEHRKNILLNCERVKIDLNQILKIGVELDQAVSLSPTEDLEVSIHQLLTSCQDLKKQLQETTLDHLDEMFKVTKEAELTHRLKNAAISGDRLRLECYAEKFSEHVDRLHDVLNACHTLYLHPTSKIAKENFDVFCEMWHALENDITKMSCDIAEICGGTEKTPEKCFNSSLQQSKYFKNVPTETSFNPEKLKDEEKEETEKISSEVKNLNSEKEAETKNYLTEENDSDIVRRVRGMTQVAVSVYQFTRGEGDLKTTQDIFNQAEMFAEDANRLYKDIRQFSYQVPGGSQKKDLLESLDKVPTYVQHLQFTVRNPTVGKAATFTKVDNVIQGVKDLMNVVSKVVTICLVCASKYKLKLRKSRNASGYSGDLDECGYGDSSGGMPPGGGGTSSSDPNI